MMTLLVIIALVLILVIPHEFGHYITARVFGVKAREFSIGMGPRVLSIKRGKGVRGLVKLIKGYKEDKDKENIKSCELMREYDNIHRFAGCNNKEGSNKYEYEKNRWVKGRLRELEVEEFDGNTEFSIRALPLGGFVRLDEDNSQSQYSSLKRWKKCIVLFAGAFMNFVTALIIAVIIAIAYRPLVPTMQIAELNGSMIDSGLEIGDEVVKVDGSKYTTPEELMYGVGLGGKDIVDVEVIRDGEEVTIHNVKLESQDAEGIDLKIFNCKFYGKEMSFAGGLKFTFNTIRVGIYSTFLSLKEMITGDVPVKAMSSIVGAGDAVKQVAEVSIGSALYLLIYILISVGVMNLLPIPALDGGHIMVNIIEGITKKKIKEEVLGLISTIVFLALMGFSMVLIGKDLLAMIKR